MSIWLKVWASDTYDLARFAVVEATPEQVDRWLALMAGVGELKESLGDECLYCLEIEDASVILYENVEELSALIEDVYAEDFVVLRHSVKLPTRKVVPQEIIRMVVKPGEIWWRSHREGTSTILITSMIPRELLEFLAAEGQHRAQNT